VKLFSHLANIGDTRSLIIHPASTTHATRTGAARGGGRGRRRVRLSIGIESVEDIIADLIRPWRVVRALMLRQLSMRTLVKSSP